MPGPGKAGRPPKPVEQHHRDGTFRPDRHNKNTAQFKKGSTRTPAGLSKGARAEWARLSPELVRLGMWTVADRIVFTGYCVAVDEYMQLTRAIGKMPSITFTTEKGYSGVVPEVGARQKAWMVIKDCSARFGLSPADRASLPIAPPPADPNAPETPESFLFGGPPSLVP